MRYYQPDIWGARVDWKAYRNACFDFVSAFKWWYSFVSLSHPALPPQAAYSPAPVTLSVRGLATYVLCRIAVICDTIFARKAEVLFALRSIAFPVADLAAR